MSPHQASFALATLAVLYAGAAEAQIPGTEELCVVMHVADEGGVDTIHIVVQSPGLNESRPAPPDRWFESRGLPMAVGTRPTPDSLKVFLTVDAPTPLYVRTVRVDSSYVGLMGFYRDQESTRGVELRELPCPG